jgi:hypothetical protein
VKERTWGEWDERERERKREREREDGEGTIYVEISFNRSPHSANLLLIVTHSDALARTSFHSTHK